MPTARQISATHHLPGLIGSVAGVEPLSAGDHRLGQMPPAQAVEDDRADVQDDQAENDVEPQFVNVAGLVGRVRADQTGKADRCRSRPHPRRSGPARPGSRPRRRGRSRSARRAACGRCRSTARADSARLAVGRERNWRTAPSSFRRSPTAGGKSASVRIAQPDQMCQSVWWFFTDHQLKAIRPASSQWTSRTAGPRPAVSSSAGRSVVHLRADTFVAGLAGLIEVAGRALTAFTSPASAAALNACAAAGNRAPWRRSPPASARSPAWRRSCRRRGRCLPGTSPRFLRQVRASSQSDARMTPRSGLPHRARGAASYRPYRWSSMPS